MTEAHSDPLALGVHLEPAALAAVPSGSAHKDVATDAIAQSILSVAISLKRIADALENGAHLQWTLAEINARVASEPSRD